MSKMSSLFDAATFLAQTAAPATAGAAGQTPSGPLQTLIGMAPIILMMGGFWFLFIAPQRKKQKEHAKMLAALDSGDEIITSGGIYGEITNKKEDRFVVRIADGVKVEIAKSFVQEVVRKPGAFKS